MWRELCDFGMKFFELVCQLRVRGIGPGMRLNGPNITPLSYRVKLVGMVGVNPSVAPVSSWRNGEVVGPINCEAWRQRPSIKAKDLVGAYCNKPSMSWQSQRYPPSGVTPERRLFLFTKNLVGRSSHQNSSWQTLAPTSWWPSSYLWSGKVSGSSQQNSVPVA